MSEGRLLRSVCMDDFAIDTSSSVASPFRASASSSASGPASAEGHINIPTMNSILGDALKAVETLDGTVIADTTLGNKPSAAQLNRELLNLADQLQFASALVRNEYWTGKGLLSYAV